MARRRAPDGAVSSAMWRPGHRARNLAVTRGRSGLARSPKMCEPRDGQWQDMFINAQCSHQKVSSQININSRNGYYLAGRIIRKGRDRESGALPTTTGGRLLLVSLAGWSVDGSSACCIVQHRGVEVVWPITGRKGCRRRMTWRGEARRGHSDCSEGFPVPALAAVTISTTTWDWQLSGPGGAGPWRPPSWERQSFLSAPACSGRGLMRWVVMGFLSVDFRSL